MMKEQQKKLNEGRAGLSVNGHIAPSKTYYDPAICIECGALFINGRWTWDDIPEPVAQTLCPACQRIKTESPAGYVQLQGAYFEDHHYEIMRLIAHIRNKEIVDHPLERFMRIAEHEGSTIITTTGTELPRLIGDALLSEYHGNLTYSYDDGNKVRVIWKR